LVDQQSNLTGLLRRHWGYPEFRPKQEAIIRSILNGRDVAAIMPTGGGKSLCYQLPAVASGSTAIVVSPLIALMQDQAAQLEQAGIPAAFLNSSLSREEAYRTRCAAERGELRLLYLSPERLVRDEMLVWLQKLPLSFFAVDEAHCISEWGHEFRPEYRQLGKLRSYFPDLPIAAFTASATRQVRHDIVHQLGLRDPGKFVLSFHRPNLRYIVRLCESKQQFALLTAALDWYDEGNVIVYAPTIKSVEETAERLEARGVPAIAYHGQMENARRQACQEAWMSGEKRVLVGTIAFGLGINKADVRAVIHLSLPKSLEQYYQEAGRAGRDGMEADCVLLWQRKDAGLLAHFIDQIEDDAEKQRAWRRYRVIRQFAESTVCRHRQICLHFGETPKWESCGVCDVCGVTLDWLAGGTEADPMPVPARRRQRAATVAARPADDALRQRLRAWRLETSRQLNLPAYVVMHDSTIDAICRVKPASSGELLEVPGIGERKAQRYGDAILRLVKQ
jgi:ATP-dependent DNA helicase RecQ